MSDAVKHISDATFQSQVLESDKTVLVDFWAPWCGPCRMIAPIVEELAEEYLDKLVVAKIDTDENPETPGKLGIRGIPTLILFSGGKEVDRMVGFAPKPVLKEKIDAAISAE